MAGGEAVGQLAAPEPLRPPGFADSARFDTGSVGSTQVPAGALTLPHRHNGNATSASGLAIVRDGCGRSFRFIAAMETEGSDRHQPGL